jgi:hypothetical protein
VYSLAFISVILIPLCTAGVMSADGTALLVALGLWYAASSTVLFVFLPKVYDVFWPAPEQEQTAASSVSNSRLWVCDPTGGDIV